MLNSENLFKLNISDDPYERLTPEMQRLIDDDRDKDEILFDTHAHIFTYNDVPDGYMGARLPFTKQFFKWAEHLLHSIIRGNDRDPLSNIAYFINIFNNSSGSEIFKKLLEYYKGNKEFRKTVVCTLMMDLSSGIKGAMIDPATGSKVFHKKSKNRLLINQMKDMAQVADDNRDAVLPFFAFDPNNEFCFDYLKLAFEEYGYFGVKVYPALGYLPSHPKLMELFSICEKKRIPVVTHCGGKLVHTSYKYLKGLDGKSNIADGNGNYQNIPKDQQSRWFIAGDSYRQFFNNPYNWNPVLKEFPELRLNLGHFGGGEEWLLMMKGKNNSWVSRILALMDQYEYVYADLSYNIAMNKYVKNKSMFEFIKERFDNSRLLRERTLYGSDYYMVVANGHFRSIKMDDLIKQIAHINPKRFLGLK